MRQKVEKTKSINKLNKDKLEVTFHLFSLFGSMILKPDFYLQLELKLSVIKHHGHRDNSFILLGKYQHKKISLYHCIDNKRIMPMPSALTKYVLSLTKLNLSKTKRFCLVQKKTFVWAEKLDITFQFDQQMATLI